MRECLDEGILQSYFDGELSCERMESVTSHLVSCVKCASAARELEGEVLLLSSALAPEFDSSVPTERLRHRIDLAVTGLPVGDRSLSEPVGIAGRGWLQSLSSVFSFSPQRAFGYAGLALMLVFGTIVGVIQLRDNQPAEVNNQNNVAVVTTTEAPVTTPTNSVPPSSDRESSATPGALASTVTKPLGVSDRAQRNRSVKGRSSVGNQAVAEVKLLPGERSYLKTIAALDSTIKSKSNRPMRPSLQAEYERNLAVVDRALAATRSAAKKNPNDPDAAEFMFNAYQSKVDLLNTVADARLYNRP